MNRNYSLADHFIIEFDRILASLCKDSQVPVTTVSPADQVPETIMDKTERRLSEGLMRVNHAGEVSAQALYQGQAMVSRDPVVRHTMQISALEETDHLAWCMQRLNELDGHTSFLNPLWFLGSFTIGTLAGIAGDKWSLGFVAETERQVVKHLQGHLQKLPERDLKSRAIVEQMMHDEARHGATAMDAGGVELPEIIKQGMRICSRIMTGTAYWL